MSPAPTNGRRQAPQPSAQPTPTRINLGPLTTAFVAPSHCSRNALACPTCNGAIRGQSCKVNGATASAEDDTGCWPRATAYPNGGQAPLLGMGYYSPGLICPTGYISACTAISQTKGQTTSPPKVTGQFQFPLEPGETAVGCCPTGYSCALNGGIQTCHQVATSTKFDAMTCEGVTEADFDGFAVPFTSGAQTIATMDLWAPMIQINHHATDLPDDQVAAVAVTSSLSTSAPTSSLLIMSTAMPSSIPTATTVTSVIPTVAPPAAQPAAPTQTGQPDQRLPLSTKVGIAFAPLIGAAAIVAVFFYLWVKKRYLYPKEHFVPKNSASPDPSEPGSNVEADEAGGKVHNMAAFSTPVPDPSYSAAHNPHDFAINGPGPVVIAQGRQEKMVDIDEESGHIDMDTYAAPPSRSLGGEDDRESLIDGTSPFRLKRGNTLRNRDKDLTADRESARRMSPLARLESVDSPNSSQDGIEWEYPLKRENSFSRPRPRPKTEASSIYVDDRASSVYSWNNAVATTEKGPLVEMKHSMKRADSFSRPRPKSEDTLVERNVGVTRGEGVAL